MSGGSCWSVHQNACKCHRPGSSTAAPRGRVSAAIQALRVAGVGAVGKCRRSPPGNRSSQNPSTTSDDTTDQAKLAHCS